VADWIAAPRRAIGARRGGYGPGTSVVVGALGACVLAQASPRLAMRAAQPLQTWRSEQFSFPFDVSLTILRLRLRFEYSFYHLVSWVCPKRKKQNHGIEKCVYFADTGMMHNPTGVDFLSSALCHHTPPWPETATSVSDKVGASDPSHDTTSCCTSCVMT